MSGIEKRRDFPLLLVLSLLLGGCGGQAPDDGVASSEPSAGRPPAVEPAERSAGGPEEVPEPTRDGEPAGQGEVPPPAGGGTASLSTCPLDPRLVELRERCDRGAEPETALCAALGILERLAHGDESAAEAILHRDFGLPPAASRTLMPLLGFFAFLAVDPEGTSGECHRAQSVRLFEVLGGFTAGSPEFQVLMWRMAGKSGVVMDKLEEGLDPATADALRVFAPTLLDLLRTSPFGKMILESLSVNPIAELAGGRLTGFPGLDDGAGEAVAAIDAALALAQEKRLDEARQAVDGARVLATDPTREALLLTRAGIGFLALGSLEDSLDCLRRADAILGEHAAEPTAAIAQAVARWFLALTYEELGLKLPESQDAGPAKSLEGGPVGEILEAFGRSFQSADPAAVMTVFQMIAEKLAARELDEQTVGPLMEVFGQVLPGLGSTQLPGMSQLPDETDAGAGSYHQGLFQVVELVLQERYDEAAGVAEAFVGRYPRYNNVYLLVLVAAKQWLAGDPAGAVAHCRKAVDFLETQVEKFRVDELQTAFVDGRIFLAFQLAVELAAREGRAEEAFAYAERLRAWTLRRLLGGDRLPRGAGAAAPDAEEARLLAEVRELERELRTAPPADRRRVTGELARQGYEFAARRLERKLASAGTDAMARIEPVALDQLRRKILAPGVTLLVYGAGYDDLWAWVVDRDSIEMVSLALPVREQRRIALLSQALRHRPKTAPRGVEPLPPEGGDGDPAAVLYSELIAPVAGYLRHQNLIVVPQGLLHHLPFAALRHPETGRYLAEDFVLSLAPSASALELILRPGEARGGEALVLGDPVTDLAPLPAARREAERVAALAGTAARLGDRATEAAVHALSGRLGLLHLAAHGRYSSSNPIFSHLALGAGDGHDGVLELHEVWDRLDLAGTRLVTLSGCETALGELTRGDEVIGLTQAFLVAGSRAVVSTLWPVDDEASEKLMVSFYRRLLGGTPAAEALRGAQRELLRDPEYAAPFFWAGYTLTGDPRAVVG